MKYGMKLPIHFITSKLQPLKFGNGQVIASHTLLGMWLLTAMEVYACYQKEAQGENNFRDLKMFSQGDGKATNLPRAR